VNFDVYALLDADGWPASATYTYVQSLSREPASPDA
jgi:hypothetical protein